MAVAGASEPQATAAVQAAPSLAARPSWVRPQQQPTAVATPAAEHTSHAEPATQLYPASHDTTCSTPDHDANADGSASCSDHPIRSWEAGIAASIELDTGSGIAGGIKAGAAVQASSAEQQPAKACQAPVTDKPAQMTHKPLVFDIEDSCDDAVHEENQAQPSFIIDIDDFADEPPAQTACGVAPAAPGSAQVGSTMPCTSNPNPHANAELPSAAPNHTQRQAALNVAGITSLADKVPSGCAATCVHHEQQQATQHAHRSPGLRSPCLEPRPGGPGPTAAMVLLPADNTGPVPTNALESVAINATGPVPADETTVPDTPPYSHASHARSPTGPTWLSPMLTKQQPGQGKQYSPSMLGRPADMPHLDSSRTDSVAAMPSSHLGPHAAQAQQALLSKLPEGQPARAVAAAACAGDVQPQVEHGGYAHPHRQSQAASRLPGSIQAASPAALVDEGRSPGGGIVAATTRVFAAWSKQEVNQSSFGLPDAAMLQSNMKQLQNRQRQQLSSTATLAPQAAQPCAEGSIHGQPRWASTLQRHQEEDSAAAKHLHKEAVAIHNDPDAKESAKLKRLCRAEEAPCQAKVTSIFHISPKVLDQAPASIMLNFHKLSFGQMSDHCFFHFCRHLLCLQML